MPRKNRAYKKGEPHRDARLFVIVAEGEREDAYFRFFQELSPRIRIKIVPREAGKSAPNFFLERIDEYRASEEWLPESDDRLWFVLDVDRWERSAIDTLHEACETEPNWHMGISNPCFEVWLHFHLGPVSGQAQNCQELKAAIPSIISGGYNISTFCPRIDKAANYARNADSDPSHFFPGSMQSKLYRLADELLALLGNNWRH